MKKYILAVLLLCMSVSPVFAEKSPPAAKVPVAEEPKIMMIVATLVDNASAAAHVKDLDKHIKNYTKNEALKPEGAASGYALYFDAKLVKFDKESNAKIEEFLKKKNSKVEVAVTVEKVGNEFKILSINSR